MTITTNSPATQLGDHAAAHPAGAISHKNSHPLFHHALTTANLPSNRALVQRWLGTLGHLSVSELLAAVAAQDSAATAFLLTEHHRGAQLATTLLLGAKVSMLLSVASHAPGDTRDERFQTTLEAFLGHALVRVDVTHTYVDQQLYWITLRTVTNAKRTHRDDLTLTREEAAEDVAVNIESYLSRDAILQWAHSRGILNEADVETLMLRYGGEDSRPVRDLAAQLGITEDALESRLRRVKARLRRAVHAHRDDLNRACVEYGWTHSDIGSFTEFGDAA